MTKQKFLKLFLILIGLLIIIFSGVFVINSLNYLDNLKFSQIHYFPYKSKQEQITDLDQAIKDSKINTSNWKTYRNEEFGFEFRYPKIYEKESCEGGEYCVWSYTKGEGFAEMLMAWGANKGQDTIFTIELYPLENENLVFQNFHYQKTNNFIKLNNEVKAQKLAGMLDNDLIVERKEYFCIIDSSFARIPKTLEYKEYINILNSLHFF